MTEADVHRLLTERKITRVEPDPVTTLEEIATVLRRLAHAVSKVCAVPTRADRSAIAARGGARHAPDAADGA